MSRLQKGMLLGLVAIGLYSGIKALVATRVAGQLDLVRAELVRHEDFQVNRMEYDHGLFSGRLDYDVLYRPPVGSPVREVLDEVHGDEALLVTGSMDVTHGPWLSGTGFGLARGDISIALPEPLRAFLPRLPDHGAVVTIQVITGFDGRTTVQGRVRDYQGRLGAADSTSVGDLTLAGLHGRVTFPASMESVSGDMALGRLVLESGGNRVIMGGLVVDGGISVENGRLDSRLAIDFDTLDVMDLTLGPGRVLASSERIDAAAYRDLITLSGAQALQGGGVRIGRLFNIVERLLAAGPRVRIDDLRISVAEEYDTRGKLSVAYAGPPRPDLFDLELLGRSFTVELGAATTEAALRRGIAVAVSSEQPQVSRREQRLATERITGHLLQVMTGLGVRRDDEGHLTVKIALLDGQLTVNGEPSSMGALSRNLTGSREPE